MENKQIAWIKLRFTTIGTETHPKEIHIFAAYTVHYMRTIIFIFCLVAYCFTGMAQGVLKSRDLDSIVTVIKDGREFVSGRTSYSVNYFFNDRDSFDYEAENTKNGYIGGSFALRVERDYLQALRKAVYAAFSPETLQSLTNEDEFNVWCIADDETGYIRSVELFFGRPHRESWRKFPAEELAKLIMAVQHGVRLNASLASAPPPRPESPLLLGVSDIKSSGKPIHVTIRKTAYKLDAPYYYSYRLRLNISELFDESIDEKTYFTPRSTRK